MNIPTTRLDFVRLAKELTGSTNVDDILSSADKLQAYFSSSPDSLPQSFADFLARFRIRTSHEGSITMRPYPFQTEFAIRLQHQPYLVHCTARQMGGSTVLAAYALWAAQIGARKKIIFIGNRLVSAIELGERIMYGYDDLPEDIRVPVTERNKGSISFDNGSSVRFYSAGSNLSGLFDGADCIIFDNAAFVSHSASADLLFRIANARKEGAQIIVSSTPVKQQGFFWEVWSAAQPHERVQHSWYIHPSRDATWAESYRQMLGTDGFDREFNAEFGPNDPQ